MLATGQEGREKERESFCVISLPGLVKALRPKRWVHLLCAEGRSLFDNFPQAASPTKSDSSDDSARRGGCNSGRKLSHVVSGHPSPYFTSGCQDLCTSALVFLAVSFTYTSTDGHRFLATKGMYRLGRPETTCDNLRPQLQRPPPRLLLVAGVAACYVFACLRTCPRTGWQHM